MTTSAQRWRDRIGSLRGPGDLFRAGLYDVAEIPGDVVAREFVRAHHYSGSFPAARFRAGLYLRGELVGVAVFSHPVRNETLTSVFPELPVLTAVELGRFVLLDEVPYNAETWFLARAFELLRAHSIRGVVSFSDPVPREDHLGRVVFPGHIGTIYQAHNASYLGRGPTRTIQLLPDATVFSARAVQKIRSGERGCRYAARQLEAFGADPLSAEADREARMEWLRRWSRELLRPLRHSGNHRYAWALARAVHLPTGRTYPKARAA